jgi:hypothetical protein
VSTTIQESSQPRYKLSSHSFGMALLRSHATASVLRATEQRMLAQPEWWSSLPPVGWGIAAVLRCVRFTDLIAETALRVSPYRPGMGLDVIEMFSWSIRWWPGKRIGAFVGSAVQCPWHL